MNARQINGWLPLLFLGPAVCFLAVFTLLPLLRHLWVGISAFIWFEDILTQGAQKASISLDLWFFELKNAFNNTVIILLVAVTLQTIQATGLALLTYNFPHKKYFWIVAMAFVPPIFGVAIWSHFTHMFFAAFDGIYYDWMLFQGREEHFFAYFDEPKTAIISIGLLTGLLFFGGPLQNALIALGRIPHQFSYTAELAGMSFWQRFWKIQFPYIRATTLASITFGLISTSTIFHAIYAIHGVDAGPNHAYDSLHSLTFRTILQQGGFNQDILGSVAVTVNFFFSAAILFALYCIVPKAFRSMVSTR